MGVLRIRAILFGVYSRALDFGKPLGGRPDDLSFCLCGLSFGRALQVAPEVYVRF